MRSCTVNEKFTHINQPFDTFLNILRVRLESRTKLSSHFINEVVVSHVLSVFHDANDARLRNDERQSLENMRLQYEVTSVWCCLSSSIRSRVSFRSLVVSTLADTVLILIFCIGHEKSLLKENESDE